MDRQSQFIGHSDGLRTPIHIAELLKVPSDVSIEPLSKPLSLAHFIGRYKGLSHPSQNDSDIKLEELPYDLQEKIKVFRQKHFHEN